MLFLVIILLFANNLLVPASYLIRSDKLTRGESYVLALIALLVFQGIVQVLAFSQFLPSSSPAVFSLFLFVINIFRWRSVVTYVGSEHSDIGAYAILTVWSCGWALLIQSFSGGGWYYDWYEHFLRALYFLNQHTEDGFALTSRPPLVNMITAFYMAQTSSGFPSYQLITMMLGSLTIFPLLLCCRDFIPRTANATIVTAFLLLALMGNPMILQNIAYTWTRALTNFFILTAIYFYSRSLREHDVFNIALAYTALAIGFVSHYSTGPFLIVLSLHLFVVSLFRRKISLLLASFISVPIVIPWIIWAVSSRGVGQTLSNNTSVQGLKTLSPGGMFGQVVDNVVATVVPHFFRHVTFDFWMTDSALNNIRNFFFYLYQTNILFALGMAGIVSGVFIAIDWWQGRVAAVNAASRRMAKFWIYFTLSTIVFGTGVHGTYDQFGVAHICLQPLAAIGVVFCVTRFTEMKRWQKLLIIVAWVCDVVFGVALHHYLEMDTQFPYNSGLKKESSVIFLSDALGINPSNSMALLLLLTVLLIGSSLSVLRTCQRKRPSKT